MHKAVQSAGKVLKILLLQELVAQTPPPLADSSALCVSCGLCCSGVLFADAKATAAEIGRVRRFGLETFRTETGADRFRLPCHHLSGGACTIYAERFSTCRNFKCALLKRLESGEVALADGQAAVARAKELLAPVIAADPHLRNVLARRALRREDVAALPPERRAAAGRLLLDTLVLDRFLDSTFRESGEDEAAD